MHKQRICARIFNIFYSTVQTKTFHVGLSAAISVVFSFLSYFLHDNDDASCETLNWTWMLPLSVNVQFFIWQTCHNSFPAKYCCLLQCWRAAAVWHGWGFLFVSWYWTGQYCKGYATLVSDLDIIALLVVWNIRCTRNNLVFQEN
jgi:hypothetical protein